MALRFLGVFQKSRISSSVVCRDGEGNLVVGNMGNDVLDGVVVGDDVSGAVRNVKEATRGHVDKFVMMGGDLGGGFDKEPAPKPLKVFSKSAGIGSGAWTVQGWDIGDVGVVHVVGRYGDGMSGCYADRLVESGVDYVVIGKGEVVGFGLRYRVGRWFKVGLGVRGLCEKLYG